MNHDKDSAMRSRRSFLSKLAAASTVSCAPGVVLASTQSTGGLGVREIKFHHLHTGEKLAEAYRTGDQYDLSALRRINHLLRDFRTGDVAAIDLKLLEILHRVTSELAVQRTIQVIGGYRSPKTNAMLAKRSNGVAKRSLHMQGRAIDIRIPGIKTKEIREFACDLHLGGVGYYRSSDFVHLDTGRPRSW